MAPNDISQLLKRTPFQPLRIVLSDGAHYDLDQHSFAQVVQTTLIVGTEIDASHLPHSAHYIDARHVVRVEIMAIKQGSKQ